MLKAYLALFDVVPVCEVTFRPGVERLDAVLDKSLGLIPTPAPVGTGA